MQLKISPSMRRGVRRTHVAAAASALVVSMFATTVAYAVEIDTGVPSAVLRWDNTVRYNFGYRVQAQDAAILANANYDDGDRNVDQGHPIAGRVDLLSELDLVVDKKYGPTRHCGGS